MAGMAHLLALWPQILEVLLGLHIFLGVVNKAVVKHGSPPTWWKTMLDLTGAFSQRGASGAIGPYSPPGMRSRVRKARPTPLAALLPPLFLAFSGCTAAQIAAWRTSGIDALKCLQPSVVDAAGDALVTLLGRLDPGASSSFDYSALGKALAQKYGTEAALCAVGKAWANLAPTIGMSPDRRAVALGWLIQHQSEWAAK